MLDALNPYQFMLFSLAMAGMVLLVGIWVRYDRLPHGKYLLIGIMLWPTLLLDEFLRGFGWWQNAIFLAGLFQFVPSLLAGMLLIVVHKLLVLKPLQGAFKYYIPALVMLAGQVPFLILPTELKQQYLLTPPTGNIAQNWPYLAPHLLSGFVLLICSTKVVELFSHYHQHLSDQVVDVQFYQFNRLNLAFSGLIAVSFIDILLATLATFDLMALAFWQTIVNLLSACIFWTILLLLLELRRFAPSPIDPDKLEDHRFSEEFLRFTLKKAEEAIIKHKAYKKIGLHISQLAEAAKVEPQALAVATRVILKRNFRAFIYHYRLEYAKKILMRTDAKVSTVAKRLGFNSEKFLSGVFIKYIQMMGKEPEALSEEEEKLF